MNNNSIPQTDPGNLYNRCVAENAILRQLVQAYKSYIDLLDQEINEFSSLAYARHPDWNSSRWEKGAKHRENIQEITNRLV